MSLKYAWKGKSQYNCLEKGLGRYLHKARVSFIMAALNEIIEDNPGLSLLDLGCGDGVLTMYMAQDKRLLVVAADSDIDRIRKARDLTNGCQVRFLVADLVCCCFRDSRADIVLLHHVLEHVDNDKKLLADCFAMLKEGGFLILGVPNEGSLLGRLMRFLHRGLYEKGEHINFYSERGVVKNLKDTGFEIIKIGRIGFLFPFYYLHMLLISNPFTFGFGNFLTKILRISADSLIIIAKKDSL
jgi:2-polyprenyl-3-methyl-5-hydroxy-6-metoxy-1,4-benzoquinol methylase